MGEEKGFLQRLADKERDLNSPNVSLEYLQDGGAYVIFWGGIRFEDRVELVPLPLPTFNAQRFVHNILQEREVQFSALYTPKFHAFVGSKSKYFYGMPIMFRNVYPYFLV